MPVVKQKTVGDTTLVLKRFKAKNRVGPDSDNRFVYEIHDSKGNIVEEDAGSTKDVAMGEFERTVEIFQKKKKGTGPFSDSSGSKRRDPFDLDVGLF